MSQQHPSSQLGERKPFVIGYVGNVKKNKQFFEPFVEYCNRVRKNICSCVEIVIEKSTQNIDEKISSDDHDYEWIKKQPRVDVLFFKVTDDMVIEKSDIHAARRLKNLQYYIDLHEKDGMKVVEPLHVTRRFLDRIEIHNFLETQLASSTNVKIPHMYFISEKQDLDKLLLQQSESISYPLVCKTVAACGKSETHHMAIVFNNEQFKRVVYGDNNDAMQHTVSTPLIAQQFVNHNSTLYKIYVIGERVFYQIKPSLKNLSSSQENANIITFDSQKPFDSSISDTSVVESSLTEISYDENIQSEQHDFIFKQVSNQLRKALDVSLFGFDLVKDCRGDATSCSQYYVVDVNYFPSYKGISREILFDYIVEHLEQRVEKE
ncbi:hypothetical protein C9374_005994 [Naegleria lovaniensis]|uniref:ATP-grasp domain-containing protein n=1 Tax=Naegleria lovaniensis TaxID=51637 RepID=A0AA88GK45_NAELO|nr:uncharacterized protein C9374_014212 [Naegleria lovaniensis]XP_044547290.1 uncharacterized protein C9374_005994 [Naegleria lovaniensis]KAG2370797.1 hypothetical protein C9374_014212 [Naegleria lovaniensis]KAG2381610.1 hypothetical protein C9374_005994 [Naegleria lovaniensis]